MGLGALGADCIPAARGTRLFTFLSGEQFKGFPNASTKQKQLLFLPPMATGLLRYMYLRSCLPRLCDSAIGKSVLRKCFVIVKEVLQTADGVTTITWLCSIAMQSMMTPHLLRHGRVHLYVCACGRACRCTGARTGVCTGVRVCVRAYVRACVQAHGFARGCTYGRTGLRAGARTGMRTGVQAYVHASAR